MSIKIVDSDTLDSALSEVADAIREKSGTSEQLEFPDEFISAIENIPSGGAVADDVRFIDYDGEIVAEYSKEAFLALTEMPANPSHTGLTAQGWNWALADAKAYVTTNDFLDIGQMYVTDDGTTRVYIEIVNLIRNELKLIYTQTVSNGVEVDWGDGSAAQKSASTGKISVTHSYNEIGNYVIKLKCISGELNFNDNIINDPSNSSYDSFWHSLIKKVEFGNATTIGRCFYSNCLNMESVTIPNSVTSMNGTFSAARSKIKHITVPNTVTSVGNEFIEECNELVSISLPKNITDLGTQFARSCTHLIRISIPEGVTEFKSECFDGCYNLIRVTGTTLITTIGAEAFENCYSLNYIPILNNITLGNRAFANCYSIKNADILNRATSIGDYAVSYSGIAGDITVNVSSIGQYAFSNCVNITSMVIGGTLTSINALVINGTALKNLELGENIASIASNSISNPYLLKIIYPKTITTVGNISGIPGLLTHDFTKCVSIPTLGNITMNPLSKIVVPDALYDEWITTSGWSTYAARTLKNSERGNY